MAAHITAAAPGGPRYNPTLTQQERSGSGNGIWLCVQCSNLIDKDASAYPVEILQNWKVKAEERARGRLAVTKGNLAQDFMVPTVESLYRRNFERFVREYLGGPGKVVAFGGRDEVFDTLDAWLSDPGGMRRVLVTAPGGMGKSALLLRWSEAVRARVATVYVPISIRFETSSAQAFYSLMAANLARIAGRPLPPTTADIAATHAEFCADLLDAFDAEGRPLLIVIDGLDEAIGWEPNEILFGPDRRNTKILVAARPMLSEPDQRPGERWLERLGWHLDRDAEIVDLTALDRGGVAAIVGGLGLGILDGSVSVIVDELFRLSEGDPLLLGYLLEDLANSPFMTSAELTVDLRTRAAGFSEYFRMWVDRQRPIWAAGGRDPLIFESVLALLASAIGPLALGDIEALLDRMGHPPTVLERPLQDLARFVLRVEGGFVLAHPRLGEHLRTKFFRSGALVKRACQAIIDWGVATLDALENSSGSDNASIYLVRFFVRHMIDAGLPAAMLARVGKASWLLACEHAEGSLLGYTLQLRAAADYAVEHAAADDPVLGWWLAAEIILNSVRNASAIPPQLLAASVKHGLLSPNQAVQQLAYSNLDARARGLVALLPFLPQGQRVARLEEALAITPTIADPASRLLAHAAVVGALPPSERRDIWEEELCELFPTDRSMLTWLEQIDAVAAVVTDERALWIAENGLAQAQGGTWRYLREALKHLDGRAIAYAWARIQDKEYPKETAISSIGIPSGALASLFRFLPASTQQQCWAEALQIARGLQDGFERPLALAEIQPAVPIALRAALDEEMLEMTREANVNDRIWGLSAIAERAHGPVAVRALELGADCAIEELSGSSYYRLAPFTPMLSGPQLDRAFETAVRAGYSVRCTALEDLAPKLDASQVRRALDNLRWFDDASSVGATRVTLAGHLGAAASEAAITAYLNRIELTETYSELWLLLEFLGGAAIQRVPIPPRVLVGGILEQLKRAVPIDNEASALWWRRIMADLGEVAGDWTLMSVLAPFVPDELIEVFLKRLPVTPDWNKNASQVETWARLAQRDDAYRQRALDRLERYRTSISDRSWPSVAVAVRPLLPTNESVALTQQAIEAGIRSGPDRDTLIPLLELGADPELVVDLYLERPVGMNEAIVDGLLARLDGAPLSRVLDDLTGGTEVTRSTAVIREARISAAKAFRVRQRIAESSHKSRHDLMRAIAEQAEHLFQLEGEEGIRAALVGIDTIERRFS
ncbi:hypothetical protein GCM10009087_18650 [Sphingomonas oligophenolica]|uniref:ATP-binding protein n=1 Tax=Sphingomonas oligophenolica TaxID=301154 RepID=A0ABU9Y3A1_9SPHN